MTAGTAPGATLQVSPAWDGLGNAVAEMLVGVYAVDQARERLTGPGRREQDAIMFDVERAGAVDALADAGGRVLACMPYAVVEPGETYTVRLEACRP